MKNVFAKIFVNCIWAIFSWDFLGLFGTFWDFLGLFGTFWDFLGLFGTFWDFLGPLVRLIQSLNNKSNQK
jgi:hypothetical protein